MAKETKTGQTFLKLISQLSPSRIKVITGRVSSGRLLFCKVEYHGQKKKDTGK